MHIKFGVDGRKTNRRPHNTPFNLINLYKDRENLKKRVDFQIKMKRKYLFHIKKLRKENNNLKKAIKADEHLMSLLSNNTS